MRWDFYRPTNCSNSPLNISLAKDKLNTPSNFSADAPFWDASTLEDRRSKTVEFNMIG